LARQAELVQDVTVVDMPEPETESRIAVWPAAATEGTVARRLSLLVMGASGVFTSRVPSDGELTIGRSDRCTVVIDDPLLSREHAVLRIGVRNELTDLGSSNGTRVGDRELAAHAPEPLAVGEVVSVGSHVLLLKSASSATSAFRACPASPRAPIANGALERLRPWVERIARGNLPVLITGETGVGKDLLANMVHALSPRRLGPFVSLNCAAIPEQLFEGELFGYERGAFTGAERAKPGLLESAEGGTVFLDEVGEMPLAMQAKLLRAVDQREVMRIGARKPRAIDVRFVSATNRDLEADALRGAFREDLYYRLHGVTLVVPPLRDRVPEIAPLARMFAHEAARRIGKDEAPVFDHAVIARLERHAWPGNVRELRNVVERAVLLSRGGPLTLEHLPEEKSERPLSTIADERLHDARARSLEDARARIVDALRQCDGNQTHAATVLGISRRAIITRIAKHGLARPRRGTRP
jgi:two-component system response regulator AtoC